MRADYGRAYRRPPPLKLWQWAEANIELSMRQPTMRQGRYRTSLTPYVRGIFDAIEDPSIERITVCKGAQTGLTLMGYIAICYWIAEDPDPILMVMPSATMGKSQSETRLQPLIEDSPRVAMELTSDPDDFKKMQYVFRRAQLNIVGANSPSNLATRPIRYLYLDEPDKYPEQSRREAGATSLAIERTNTYSGFRKILTTSTPTIDTGYIWQELQRSDCRELFVRCESCQHEFPLSYKCIKYDAGESIRARASSARWACPSCAAEFDDAEKTSLVASAEWKPTKEAADPGHAGFHLPAFYAPWITAEICVRRFLEAKDNPSDLQGVINSIFAQPWRPPPKEQIPIDHIREIADERPYLRRTIPTNKPCYLYATIDVQKAHVHVHVWAARLTEQYLVDRFILGTIEDIGTAVFGSEYADEEGNRYKPQRALLDTGFDTMKAYAVALAEPRIIPIKGERGAITRMSKPVLVSRIDSFPGGRMFGGRRSLQLVHIHPRYFKDQLMDALNGKGGVRIGFFQEIDRDFQMQMTAEVIREMKPDKYGNVDTYYEKLSGRPNEDFDCAQYAFAARHLAHAILVRNEQQEQETDTHEQATRQDAPHADAGRGSTIGEIRIDPNAVRL